MEIQLSMLLFQLINFGIVVGALTFLLYKPVFKIFEERAKRIEEGQRAAVKALANQEKIDELKAKTEKELREKTAAILKEATDEAKNQREAMLLAAKAEADALIDSMKQEFKEDWNAHIRTQEHALVASVYDIVAKVIPASLSAKQQSSLVDAEIAQLIKQL